MTYKPKDSYRKNIKTWPNDIMHDIHQVTRIPGSNFCSSELVGFCYFSLNTSTDNRNTRNQLMLFRVSCFLLFWLRIYVIFRTLFTILRVPIKALLCTLNTNWSISSRSRSFNIFETWDVTSPVAPITMGLMVNE